MNGCIERLSDTARGPPTPWNSLSPRSLSSERLKYGSTSSYDQPVQPSSAHSSKSARLPAQVDHRVDRARAADHAAAGEVEPASAEPGLLLAVQVPVEARLEGDGEHRRDVELRCGVRAACLEHAHRDVRVLAQTSGEHAPRRAGSDDHVISHRALLRSGLRPASLIAGRFRYQECWRGTGRAR